MKPKTDKPFAGKKAEKRTTNFAIRWRRLFFVNYSPRYIRLKGDLCTYKKHLEALSAKPNDGTYEKGWIADAMKLCDDAVQKLSKVRIDEGWKLLHEAQRMEVYSNQEYRHATIIQLREEAVKLNKWRMDSIYKIVGYKDDDAKVDKVGAAELELALQLRDEHYHSLYYTNRLTRGQFNRLFFILGLIIALILWYVCATGISTRTDMSQMNASNLIGILLLGSLGATTSTIFHFRNSQSSSRIPEIISNNSITMSRIFVGAGFSFFVFIFLNSTIAQTIDIFKFKLDSCYEFFTIAFVSGFSERFALNSIQKIIGKKE
uniref:hypothetical protein n=1 Tax=uncultured Draconibacterium sp. TaxID=1573823 RepID=UPI0032173522